MLDFPHPFGPTIDVSWEGNETVVGSTNDLKPESLTDFNFINLRIIGGRKPSPRV